MPETLTEQSDIETMRHHLFERLNFRMVDIADAIGYSRTATHLMLDPTHPRPFRLTTQQWRSLGHIIALRQNDSTAQVTPSWAMKQLGL